jgi:hypothetical protein
MRKIVILLMALGLLFSAAAAQADLEGTILKVGVGASGGLVDLTASEGITFKPGPLPNDYTYPGNPWEFYSIGVGGSFVTGGVATFENPSALPITTTIISTPLVGTQQANTAGPAFAVGAASIIYDQSIYFDQSYNHVHGSVRITNNTDATIHDLYYSRGMDPDQGVGTDNGFATVNTINPDGSVTAVNLGTQLFVTLRDLRVGDGGVASISGPYGGSWALDPTVLWGSGVVGDPTNFVFGGAPGNVDDSINMTWFLASLEHGQSWAIDFDYEFARVPVPPSVCLLGSGLLGLVGLRKSRKS